MHAPHSSHSSLICVSSLCSPGISVPRSWQGLGLNREYIKGSGLQVCEQLALTFWVFLKHYLSFPWCNWSWFLPVPCMGDQNNLFLSLLKIHLMYLKCIITFPSQYSLKYIVTLHTKTYHHFLEVISIKKNGGIFFLNIFLEKLPS